MDQSIFFKVFQLVHTFLFFKNCHFFVKQMECNSIALCCHIAFRNVRYIKGVYFDVHFVNLMPYQSASL